jgi:hypothetical protein
MLLQTSPGVIPATMLGQVLDLGRLRAVARALAAIAVILPGLKSQLHLDQILYVRTGG